MPFDSKTGAAGGRKGGVNRWRDKDPSTVRDQHIRLAVSKNELAMIDAKAEEAGISRTEFIIRAVKKYN